MQLLSCLHVSVSEDTMVWEVVTSAVLSSDPKHQNVWDSEPQGERTGDHRAPLHLSYMVIEC